MSTDDQLPTVATGGAVTVRPAGAMLVDSAAGAGALGDPAFGGVRAPALSELEPRQLEALGQTTENLWSELCTAAALTPAQLEYAEPVLGQYTQLLRQAFRAGDRVEFRRLVHNLGCDLVVVGALTVEQRQKMGAVLARANPECERLLRPVRGIIGSRRLSSAGVDTNELRELNRLMADTGSRYWKGPDAERLQARYRELCDRGVRGDAIPPTPPDQVEARIAEIERLMRDTSSDYHRGPNAAALQREYRDLIDQRDGRK